MDRTRVYRPARLTAAGLALLATAAALTLLFAVQAHAAVWVIPASARAFPTTAPGARHEIAINAAGNEYEGVQVVLRGGASAHTADFTWSTDSDPLITANTKLHRVYYVKVTRPTTHLGSHPGWYPDPLVPRDFGQDITGIPQTTTPFYLLTLVPYGTPPGDYAATLHVVNGTEVVDVPMTLHVWDFGWTGISTRSSMSVSQRGIENSLAGSGVDYGGAAKTRILLAFYAMMRAHGISPDVTGLYPKVSASGHMDTTAYAAKVAPFLDADGLDLPDTELPWLHFFPWSVGTYSASAPKLTTYLNELCRVYQTHGWQKKAYVYILDETTRTAEEHQAERLARVLHRASAKAGFRCRFLLTDDPRPFGLGGVKHANRFLYDDVDVWALRYYYFFGRIPAAHERQAHGKEIWWYPYTNTSVARIPSFVIDKPHVDARIWGWLMQRWNVDGLLNWGFNRWGRATNGQGYRDPYRDPLSLSVGKTRSNGDTSLVYPGYYPRYGLDDPYAAPVSSLRLEALRDGLEEREYLKLAKRTGSTGPAFVKKILATITQFPYPVRQANVFTFPRYTHSVPVFAAARLQLAERIEAYQK